MGKQFKTSLFPFHVVRAAIHGNSDALQKIWREYEPYINTLCSRPYQDMYGNVQYMIDQDMKDYLREQLFWAITHNFDMYYGQK